MTQLLTAEQVATLLNTSERHLLRLRAERGLNAAVRKIGGLVRFDLAAVESWVEAQTKESTA